MLRRQSDCVNLFVMTHETFNLWSIFRSISAVTRVEDVRRPGDKWVAHGDSFMEGNVSKQLTSSDFYCDMAAERYKDTANNRDRLHTQ